MRRRWHTSAAAPRGKLKKCLSCRSVAGIRTEHICLDLNLACEPSALALDLTEFCQKFGLQEFIIKSVGDTFYMPRIFLVILLATRIKLHETLVLSRDAD